MKSKLGKNSRFSFKIDRFACYASCFDFLGEVIMDRFTRKIKTTCDTEEIN